MEGAMAPARRSRSEHLLLRYYIWTAGPMHENRTFLSEPIPSRMIVAFLFGSQLQFHFKFDLRFENGHLTMEKIQRSACYVLFRTQRGADDMPQLSQNFFRSGRVPSPSEGTSSAFGSGKRGSYNKATASVSRRIVFALSLS